MRVMLVKQDGVLLVATHTGFGFKVSVSDCVSATKGGKMVVNVSGDDKLVKVEYINKDDDLVAVIGDNRKLLVFDIAELPTFTRGKGVILQKYKEPKTYLADIKTFARKNGLSWQSGSRNVRIEDVRMWEGRRASVGHMPPDRFPKSNRFSK